MKLPVVLFLLGLAGLYVAIVALIVLGIFREVIVVIGLGSNMIGIAAIVLLVVYRPQHLLVKYERLPLSVGSLIASGALFVFAGLSDIAFYLEFGLMGIGVLTLRLSLEKTTNPKL